MSDKIYIQINDKRIELKGVELETFLQNKEKVDSQMRLLEAEQQAKEAARESAMAKLKALGLTDDEISALVP